MLFDGREVSLAGVAYAAATQTDNLDAHDGYNPVKGHIGVAIIPALLALAEQAEPMSGAEMLMLVTLGYEIAGRAGLALHATVSDYHTSGAWNALGVAAMASRMRGLSASLLREAIGIAEYHGPRSQMMRRSRIPACCMTGRAGVRWSAFPRSSLLNAVSPERRRSPSRLKRRHPSGLISAGTGLCRRNM